MTVAITYYVLRQVVYRRGFTRLKNVEKHRSYLYDQCGAQPVEFKARDGLNLAGLLIVRPQAKRVIILCHGYGMCKEYMRLFVDMFPQDSILAFDFRAHGESDGFITSIGSHEIFDVFAALAFVKNHCKLQKLPIYGVGISMGAATLLGATAQGAAFDGLILDSSFAGLDDHLNESFDVRTGLPRFPFMRVGKFLFEHLACCSIYANNPAEYARQITVPLLIIHSRDDKMVSVDHAQRIYDNAVSKKELWLVDNTQHGYINKKHTKEYGKRAQQFLKSLNF
jgi:pimeloyl-ACP methyl ester carboxylesterase